MTRWLCLAGSGFFAFLAIVPATARATGGGPPVVDETGRPSTFSAVAAAAGVHQQIDAVGGAVTTIEPVFSTAPDSLAEFGDSTARSRASTFYPGATMVSGGLLVCGQVVEPNTPIRQPICPPPASYPLSIELPIPGQFDTTDAQTPTSENLSIGQGFGALTATTAAVHAYRDYVSSDSVIGDYQLASPPALATAEAAFNQQAGLLGGVRPGITVAPSPAPSPAAAPAPADPSAIHVGSAETHVSERFPDPNNKALLLISAESVLKNISLLGGAVQIASITTTSTHQTDGIAAAVHHDQVTVSGVTVAGQPATIDQNGITIVGAGQGKPAIDALNNALQQLLAADGAVVRMVNPSGPPSPTGAPTGLYSPEFGAGCMSGEADGMQVYLPVDARQLPYPAGSIYFANVTLGSSCADATASADRNSGFGLGDIGSGGSGATASATGGGLSPSGGTSGSTSYSAGTPAYSAPTPNGGAASFASGAAAPSRRRGIQAVPALFGLPLRNRLGFLYLSFTLGFAALCLGFGRFAPARLPRHR